MARSIGECVAAGVCLPGIECVISFIFSFGLSGVFVVVDTPKMANKVSETHACKIAASMQRELEDGGFQSADFIGKLANLHSTGHENRLPKVLKEFGLQADVPVTFADIGLKHPHPTLKLRDIISTLDKNDKIQHLLVGNGPAQLEAFWRMYKQINGGHEVYTAHPQHLHQCLPMMLRLDEGTSHKKRAIMILSVQVVCGKGSKRSSGHNFLGSTYLSRYLFSVLISRMYAKKPAVLHSLFDAWRSDLDDCFRNGVKIHGAAGINRIFPIMIACKGDWPALMKAGRLKRHHLTNAVSNPDGGGICHLCRAGMRNYEWNEFEADAAWLHADNPLPWNTPSPLSCIPQNPDNLPSFFAVDLFHVCHKGVVADYVASAIAPCLEFNYAFFG